MFRKDRKLNRGCLGLVVEKGNDCKWTEEMFQGMKMFENWIVMGFAQLYTFTRNYLILHLNM